MTIDIALVLLIALVAVILFATERLRIDAVALLVLTGLVLTGLVDPSQALGGFSNSATITVAAMFVLAAGLQNSGALSGIGVAGWLVPKASRRIVASLMSGRRTGCTHPVMRITRARRSPCVTAVPGPRNMDAAGRLVRSNPLYDQQVPTPTNCRMAAVDVPSASAAEKQEHFNELMGCLMTVFAEPVEAAGFQMPRPPVVVYTRPIKTACGDFAEVNAAYCTGDQRVYYANTLLRAFPANVASAPYAAEMILAHEFGHAVQARTAILISEKYLEQDARSERAAQDLSRRTEVQADCLAGQYVRSVAQSQNLGPGELERLSGLAYNLGDDVLSGRPGWSGGHGTGAARQDWFDRGLGSDAIAACNAFVASEDEVR